MIAVMALLINSHKFKVQQEPENASCGSRGQALAHQYTCLTGTGIPHVSLVRKSILAPCN